MRDSWGTYDGRNEEPPYETVADEPGEPKQDQELVYVVRLKPTQWEHLRCQYEGEIAFTSARPEHPDRQAALEELATYALIVSYAVSDQQDLAQIRFSEAAERFRSLEAK